MQKKILHIVRHGKALQEYYDIGDYDRPLIEKGIVKSEAAANQLLEKHDAPDLIISSHAARALHTAHIFARVMNYPHAKVQVNENLYLEGEDVMLGILKNLPDEVESVMMVGHNPDMTYLASICAKKHVAALPTSGVATIVFGTDKWSKIA